MTGRKSNGVSFPLRYKISALVLGEIIPLLALIFYLIFALMDYGNAYDSIVSNMTVANNYNLDFKEEFDESIYKRAVGYVSFEGSGAEDRSKEDGLKDPYELIDGLRQEFTALIDITTDKESRKWLQRLLRNIDTLEERVDDVRNNVEAGGRYDENMEMLDNNIYILSELIQDDIQHYIYYQTKSIERLGNRLNRQVETFAVLCIFLAGAGVLVVLIVTRLVMRSITSPVENLCRITGQIASGDFSARAESGTRDEIGVLSGSVNEMTEKLEILLDKIKEDERKMRHAELRLLQEQINPHFLYNTLDTIVWLIEGNDAEKAESVVMSLSEYFRLVLSKGKEFITIREEELHIRSYLEIQQQRYKDILDYEIHIDPEIYPCRILKLTLQPLVENALYHGIKYLRAKGKITIRGCRENEKIRLTVEDNGVGMKPEELARLREEIVKPCKETEKGFGLANVNERIRMNYGPEYGLSIDSKLGEGTLVVVTLPLNQMEKPGEGVILDE